MAGPQAPHAPLAHHGPPVHHRPGGGFRNPWPDAEPHRLGEFLRWRLQRRRGAPHAPSPPRGSLPSRMPELALPRAASGHRSATWVGHATVLLQLGPVNVLTDPIWSERCSPVSWTGPRRLMAPGVDLDRLPAIDAVLISHNHYDHLDAATVRRLAARHPRALWLCPLGVGALLRRLGVAHPVERDWWQELAAPGFTATCTPAQHFSARGPFDRNRTLWGGWAIAADSTRVFFAGDTALHPEFAAIGERLGPFDLVLLPIGAYEPRWFMRRVHLDPADAVAAYRALAGPGGAAPPCLAMHWGTFRLTDEAVAEPPRRFAELWRAAGLPEAANWTLAHGETRRLGSGPR